MSSARKAKLQERARRLLEEAQQAVEKSNTPADDHAASPTVESTTRAAPPRLLAVALEKRIPLLKTGDERYVLGIVLEPEVVDAQDDIYSAAEIREAAHRFMEEYRNIGLMPRSGERAREDLGVVPGADALCPRRGAGTEGDLAPRHAGARR